MNRNIINFFLQIDAGDLPVPRHYLVTNDSRMREFELKRIRLIAKKLYHFRIEAIKKKKARVEKIHKDDESITNSTTKIKESRSFKGDEELEENIEYSNQTDDEIDLHHRKLNKDFLVAAIIEEPVHAENFNSIKSNHVSPNLKTKQFLNLVDSHEECYLTNKLQNPYIKKNKSNTVMKSSKGKELDKKLNIYNQKKKTSLNEEEDPDENEYLTHTELIEKDALELWSFWMEIAKVFHIVIIVCCYFHIND